MTEEIEEPMHMSYREAYAWQLGWDMGYKAAYKDLHKDHLEEILKLRSEREKHDTK